MVPTGANITCSKFCPNKASVLAAGDDTGVITIWKTQKTEPKMSLACEQAIQTLLINEAITHIFSGTVTGKAYVWDLETGQATRNFTGHGQACTALCTSMDNHNLLTGGQDCKVRIWDLRQQKCVATMREHKDTVNAIRLSPDGKWVASGSSDGTMKIWDIRNDTLIENFEIPNQKVTCLEFNPQLLTLANGSTDRTVKYWDMENFS